jgi:3-oxoadipate enol-lactonase
LHSGQTLSNAKEAEWQGGNTCYEFHNREEEDPMALDIIMPKMGMGMTVGKIVHWHVQSGETVQAGQVICEIESDKIAAEMPAEVDGVLTIIAAEGAEVEVGRAIGQIEPVAGAVVRPRQDLRVGAQTTQSVQANGINLNVQQSGKGPAILFIHGLASSMELWAGLEQAQFGERTLVSYDLRGHGRSDRPGGAHTLAKHVADLQGLLDALSIEQVDLVGHSLGGMIALELAATEPQRVRTLTMVASAASFPQEIRNTFFELASAASFGGMASIADTLIRLSFTPVFCEANPKMIATIRRGMMASDAASIAAAARMVAKIDLQAKLGSIRCPTQIVVGEQDVLTPPMLSEELQRGITAAQLHRLPACGHAVPVEQPTVLTERIAAFVAKR